MCRYLAIFLMLSGVVATNDSTYKPPIYHIPTSQINVVHNYWRPGAHAQRNLTNLGYWDAPHDTPEHERASDYTIGVISLGAFATALGLILVTGSACVAWCLGFRAQPSSEALRWVLLGCFVLSGCLTLGGTWGAADLSDGAHTVLSSVDDASSLFVQVKSEVGAFHLHAHVLQLLLAPNGTLWSKCPSDVQSTLTSISSAVSSASEQATDVLSQATQVDNKITSWRGKFDDNSVDTILRIFSIFSIASVASVCTIGAIGVLLKSRCLLSCASCVGVIMLLVVSLLVGCEVSLSVVLADLCRGDPLYKSSQIIKAVNEFDSSGLDALTTVSHYLDCSGTNPLGSAIDQANDEVNDLAALLDKHSQDLLQRCETDAAAAIQKLNSTTQELNSTMKQAQTIMLCSNVNPTLADVLITGSCNHLFIGFYTYWVTQTCAGLALLFTLVFSHHVQICWKRVEEQLLLDNVQPDEESELSPGTYEAMPTEHMLERCRRQAHEDQSYAEGQPHLENIAPPSYDTSTTSDREGHNESLLPIIPGCKV